MAFPGQSFQYNPLSAANGGTGLTSPGNSGNLLISNGSTWVSSTPTGGTCVAWVTFTGSTGTKNNSYNVSSVTRTGTGNYTVNFLNTLSTVYFTPVMSISNISSYSTAIAFDAGPNLNSGGYTGYASASYFKFITGNSASSVPADPAICSVAVFA